MDTENEPHAGDNEPAAKKAPRKPRPSEVAAKKAKAAKKKPKVAKAVKSKKKTKKAAKRPKKVAKTRRKAVKSKVSQSATDRTCRLDFRLTKAQKSRIVARAAKLRRTITSIVAEAIEKIK